MSCDYLRSVPIRRLPNPTEENPIWGILGSVISSFFAVALSLPFLLAFLLVLPAYLSVRWLLLFIHCSRQGSNVPGPESVSGNDSRWLGTEWRSSVIHAVLVFEAKEGVNVDHFRRLLLKRVIPLYPRLTQRLISLPILAGAGNSWMTDTKFSIDEHVFSGPSYLSNETDLQEYVSKLVSDGLPEDKSPWQLQVFQSFGISQDTVVILRVHQSVADGTALMRLLCHSLSDSQIIEIPERPRSGSLAFCMNVFRACIVGPLTLLLWVFFSEDDCNILTHRSTWTGSVTVTWSASITLPKVIRIKQVTRSTVNCVLLSALAGALRRLLQGCGVKQPPDVKVVVPIDLREETSTVRTKLGNKTTSLIMPLPVAIEGCVPRLWATRKTLDSLRTSADPIILYVATAALMSIGSASFARHLINFFTDKASLQFSSLPGPTSEILLEGQTLKGIYPILPAQANLGISITTITYANQVFVSVLADRALGPAAELILEYLEDQIEILWKLLLNRRVPGEQESPTTLYMKASISEALEKEIDSKIDLVKEQNEIEPLNESKEVNQTGKISTLKAEFSELVDELKKRQSLSEIENVDLSKTHPRTFPCSTCKKHISNSPKHLCQQSSYSDVSPNHDSKESKYNAEEVESMPSKLTNFNFRQESHFKSTSKFVQEEREPNDRSVEFKGAKTQKDCVINISENNFSLYSSQQGSGQKARPYPYEIESNRDHILKADSKSGKSKRTTNLSNMKLKKDKPMRTKIKSEDFESEEVGSHLIKMDRISGEELKNEKSETEREESLKVKPDALRKVIEMKEDKKASYCSTGPNDLNCDLHYQKYLEVFQVEEKQLFPVGRQPHEIRAQDKIDDPDESDIAGGVLI